MNLIIGTLTVFICTIGGYVLEGGHVEVLLKAAPLEILIMGGTAVGGFVVANSSVNIKRTLKGVGLLLKKDALEFLEECADLELVLAPVGGGGLLSGTAVAAKASPRGVRVIGCEPLMADDAQRSVRAGHIVPQIAPRTIADGLRTSLGDLTFAIISKGVEDIVTVTEDSIVEAMRLAWSILKIVIEPSSAVPLAALLERRIPIDRKNVGVILSGGNVDLDRLPWTKAAT